MKLFPIRFAILFSLSLVLGLIPFQRGLCECAQPGAACGGSSYKPCCDPAKYECRSIYNDKVIEEGNTEIGECKEKKK